MAKFVFTQSSSDYSRMQQNLIEAGARSWTPLGSLQRSPDLPAGREGLPLSPQTSRLVVRGFPNYSIP